MNTIGYFEIQSSDPDREINFYNSVFGWDFIRESYVPLFLRVAGKDISSMPTIILSGFLKWMKMPLRQAQGDTFGKLRVTPSTGFG